MILQPNEQEKEAIARIAITSDGQKYIAYLKKCLEARDIENRTAEDVFIGRGQGRALQLVENIEILDKSTVRVY